MYSGINLYYLQRKWYSKGYTLIEVLVGIAIFSAMIVLAGMALNQGLREYHGLAEKGLGFWENAKILWIDKSFNSMIDYYVYTRSEGWFPYFKGDQQGISYVSLSPFASEKPVVAWIRHEPQENGKRTLLYYELPVYTKTYEEIERNELFNDYKKGSSLKIVDGVENLEFQFFGYDLIEKKSKWFHSFYGKRMKMLPSSVLISYHHNGKREKLIFGVNVNSTRKMVYNEIFIR